jgi:hypothetical protein
VTKTGLQNLVKHTQKVVPTPSPTRDQSDVLQFDPSSYRSVHNLATNTDRRAFEDLLKKTAEAIFMSKESLTPRKLLLILDSKFRSVAITDISQSRLRFGFSLLCTDRVPFELLDSAALL